MVGRFESIERRLARVFLGVACAVTVLSASSLTRAQEGREEVAPYGYKIRPEPNYRKGLVIAGAATFAGSYAYNVMWGIRSLDDNPSDKGARMLFVPCLGPLLYLATGDFSGMGPAGLMMIPLMLLGSGAQLSGVAMIVAGAKPIRPKNQFAGLTLDEPLPPLKPELLFGPGSIGMRMHF